MKFIAEINVMPQKEILDPQGKAVKLGLHNLGIDEHITLALDADSEADAKQRVETACSKLLANMIMEDYSFTLTEG